MKSESKRKSFEINPNENEILKIKRIVPCSTTLRMIKGMKRIILVDPASASSRFKIYRTKLKFNFVSALFFQDFIFIWVNPK